MNKKILISIIIIIFVAVGAALFLVNQKPVKQGKCGDGICGKKELANSNLCPSDCEDNAVRPPENICPRLMPPSPRLKKECEKSGGKLKANKNNNGCYFGYECEKAIEKTCSEQNGNICSQSKSCSGSWFDAPDTNKCCRGSCVTEPISTCSSDEECIQSITYVAMGASVSVGAAADPREVNGYVYLVRDELEKTKNVNFKNVARGGTKVEYFLGTELPEALALNPDMVTILVGGNDIITGTDVEDFSNNLDIILKGLKDGGANVFIINTPNLVNYPKFVDGSYEFVTLKRINEFNQVSKEKADKYGFDYVNMFNSALSTDMSLISADGIHPTKEGHKIIANKIIEKIKETIII